MSARNEERIRIATEVFDQEVKDKMIDLDQEMDGIKYTHQKINKRAEENDAFSTGNGTISRKCLTHK